MANTPVKTGRTELFNWLVLIVSVLTMVADSEVVKQYPQVVAWIVTGVAVANIVLQYLSGQPIRAALKGIRFWR